MKETSLGEFQEFVLLMILANGNEAYGAEIQRELNNHLIRNVSRGSLHTALSRLVKKGFLKTRIGGATDARGGRRKKYYSLTADGKYAVQHMRNLRNRIWKRIPSLEIDGQ